MIDYILEETTIQTGGVLSCCLEGVGTEYETKSVHVGDKSKCKYCKEKFTLVEKDGSPIWYPNWQLNKEN